MSSIIIESMLEKYRCKSQADYERAIHETIQEIALLGLWRSKFFEHAAFYGGTALRILYGLNRFSEDLDFSLLKPNAAFDLSDYNTAIKMELNSFGFTENQYETMKAKMNIDMNPPLKFHTEAKLLHEPISFSVHCYTLPCLFAANLHAQLSCAWKGRDWYDFVWYLGRKIKPDLGHLQARLIQSGNWPSDKKLEDHDLKELLLKRIQNIDFDKAKEDVVPFITDPMSLDVWSKDFFTEVTEQFLVL